MAITLKQAETMIDMALAEAAKNKFNPLTVVVLDCGGHIKAIKRQDNASFLRPEIALGKAWGALALGANSRDLQDLATNRPAFMNSLATLAGGKIMPVPGGMLIADASGELVGAIGITGDTSDHDEQCALAGIQAAGLQHHKTK